MKKITLSFLMALFLSNASQAQSNKNADEIKSIITFSKLYGIGKYFQNSKLTDRIDWEKFCILGIEKVLEAKNQYELYQICKRLFEPLSTTIQIHYGFPEKNGLQNPNSQELHYKVFHGPGMDNHWFFIYRWLIGKTYYFEKKVSDLNSPDTLLASLSKIYSEKISDSLYVEYRVGNEQYKASSKQASALLKQTKQIKIDNTKNQNSRFFSHRAASVVILWNVVKYFYPYPASLPSNWENCLETYLQKAHSDNTMEEFFETLKRMVSDIQDGHGLVLNSMGNSSFISYGKRVFLPEIELEYIENQMVIIGMDSAYSSKIHQGDILIAVNQIPIKEYINSQEQYFSGSSHRARMQQMAQKMFMNFDSTALNLSFLNSKGDTISMVIQKTSNSKLEAQPFNPLPNLEFIGKGILYINPCAPGYQFKKAKKMIQADETKKVVLDIRSRPALSSFHLLSYCSNRPFQSPDLIVPRVYTAFYSDSTRNEGYTTRSRNKGDKKEIIALSSGTLYSFPETFLACVKINQMGVVIGEQTAGTNGDIASIDLPVWGAWFTGLMTKNAGQPHHGIGIMPDIEVRPTIKGIREGRDELLERVLEYIKMNK